MRDLIGDGAARAGYSGTPLVQKLGIRSGMNCTIIEPPDGYEDLLGGLPDSVTVAIPSGEDLDFVHLFVQESEGLTDQLRTLKGQIAQNGMIWVSWPKKASKVQTDVTENVVRKAGLSVGLVDVKVCAVDDTWSGKGSYLASLGVDLHGPASVEPQGA
jgi:S1-C subfamily serine protease